MPTGTLCGPTGGETEGAYSRSASRQEGHPLLYQFEIKGLKGEALKPQFEIKGLKGEALKLQFGSKGLKGEALKLQFESKGLKGETLKLHYDGRRHVDSSAFDRSLVLDPNTATIYGLDILPKMPMKGGACL